MKGNPTISQFGKLEKLLTFHRNAVAALETSLGLLRGQSQASSTSRAAKTIAAAIEHDAARRTTTKTGKRRGRPPKVRATDDAPPPKYGKAARKRRAKTAKFLDLFSTKKARAAQGSSTPLGPLVRRGYLTKNGDGGYLRTAKEFVI